MPSQPLPPSQLHPMAMPHYPMHAPAMVMPYGPGMMTAPLPMPAHMFPQGQMGYPPYAGAPMSPTGVYGYMAAAPPMALHPGPEGMPGMAMGMAAAGTYPMYAYPLPGGGSQPMYPPGAAGPPGASGMMPMYGLYRGGAYDVGGGEQQQQMQHQGGYSPYVQQQQQDCNGGSSAGSHAIHKAQQLPAQPLQSLAANGQTSAKEGGGGGTGPAQAVTQ